MSDFSRFSIFWEVSENSDYSNPYAEAAAFPLLLKNPSAAVSEKIKLPVGTVTIVLSAFSSPLTRLAIICPTSNAATVNIQWTDATTVGLNQIFMNPGDVFVVPNIRTASSVLLVSSVPGLAFVMYEGT